MPPKPTIRQTFFALLLFVAAAVPLNGQARGAVFGMVVDDRNDEPIVGAQIAVKGRGDKTVSDQDGFFVLDGLPVGRTQLTFAFPSYSTSIEQIEIASDTSRALEIRLLPIATALDELKVTAHRGTAGTSMVEVRPDVGSLTAADLLARIPNLRFSSNLSTGISVRGATSFTSSTAPSIYLDGIRIAEFVAPNVPDGAKAISILSRIPAHEVVRIAVLRGASASAQYGEAANGVILIETSRGSAR